MVLASMPATATVWQEARKVPPAINLDTTDKAWNDFYMALLQYKDESALVGQAITRQPYACCTTEQATSLSHTLSEAQLVEHMKALTVRYQNPAVHVHEFLGLSQQADERVRHYLSRLKGVASRHNFEVQCSCGITNSFTEAITRFKLIAGLVDTNIKRDILSKSNMNLEETVKAAEGKESGKVAKLKVYKMTRCPQSSQTTNTPAATHPPKPNVAGIVTELAIPPTQLKGRHLAQHGARNVTLVGKRVISRAAAKVGRDNPPQQPIIRSQRVITCLWGPLLAS